MKIKMIIPIILAIFFGYLIGQLVYTQYEYSEQAFNEQSEAYFLQYGVFSNEQSFKENVKDLPAYTMVKEKDKYYVYVGISRNKDNVEKIKTMYQKKGYDLYTKNMMVNNMTFISNLDQYDLLLTSAIKDTEITAINKVILASFEEINSNG